MLLRGEFAYQEVGTVGAFPDARRHRSEPASENTESLNDVTPEPRPTLTSDRASRKAFSPIDVTLGGMMIDVTPLYSKADVGIEVRFELRATVVRERVSLKTLSPMVVTLEGTEIESRPVSSNALSPMAVRLELIETLVSDRESRNAPTPRVVTFGGMTTEVRPLP
jgi:hypothetical protein